MWKNIKENISIMREIEDITKRLKSRITMFLNIIVQMG